MVLLNGFFLVEDEGQDHQYRDRDDYHGGTDHARKIDQKFIKYFQNSGTRIFSYLVFSYSGFSVVEHGWSLVSFIRPRKIQK
jgi:hypothetical protein